MLAHIEGILTLLRRNGRKKICAHTAARFIQEVGGVYIFKNRIDGKLCCMLETLNLWVINLSLTIMGCFFALEPSFEREVQKQPGSSRGEAQSAVSTNAHGTYTGLGGKK